MAGWQLWVARVVTFVAGGFGLFAWLVAFALICFDTCASQPTYTYQRIVLALIAIALVAAIVGPWLRHRLTAVTLTALPLVVFVSLIAAVGKPQTFAVGGIFVAAYLVAAVLVAVGLPKRPAA